MHHQFRRSGRLAEPTGSEQIVAWGYQRSRGGGTHGRSRRRGEHDAQPGEKTWPRAVLDDHPDNLPRRFLDHHNTASNGLLRIAI